MSVRMRHTRGHTGNRRSHHALKAATVIIDPETGQARLPHRVNEASGIYRGRQVFAPKQKAEKRSKVHGPDTEPREDAHVHERARVERENAEIKGSQGVIGKLTGGGRPKARSGAGGGGA